jgi:hypothetical protein
MTYGNPHSDPPRALAVVVVTGNWRAMAGHGDARRRSLAAGCCPPPRVSCALGFDDVRCLLPRSRICSLDPHTRVNHSTPEDGGPGALALPLEARRGQRALPRRAHVAGSPWRRPVIIP